MNIYMFIGTIASGKSAAAKIMAKEGCIIINDDAIINMLHGGIYTLYDKKLKPLYKSIENHIFNMARAMNKSVVIDRGVNLTVKSRKRWIGLANSLDQAICAITFPFRTPEKHVKDRIYNSIEGDRGLSYETWLQTVNYHFKTYEPPTIEEGFMDIYTSDFMFRKDKTNIDCKFLL